MTADVLELQQLTEASRPITYGVVKPGEEDPDKGVLFIRGGDIVDGNIDVSVLRTITQEVSAPYARTILCGGEVVISLVGNPGAVAVVPDSLAGANLARQVGLVALKREHHAPYVKYYLMSPQGKAELFQRTQGAVQQVINLADLKKIKIRVLSRPEQERVADVLSAYDDLIENNRRRVALLEESARLLYREWFAHLRFPGHEHVKVVDHTPEGWEVRRLEEFSDEVRVSIRPGQIKSGTPYIGLEHMPRRSITLSEWGQSEDVTSQKFAYEAGDILFGRIRPYFHKVGFTLTEGITSSDAIVLRPVKKELSNFLLLLVSSDQFVAMATQTVKEGSKMPRADWKYMKRQPFAVPPDWLLRELNEILDPILRQLKSLASASTQARRARDLLLPRLMSGEVVV